MPFNPGRLAARSSAASGLAYHRLSRSRPGHGLWPSRRLSHSPSLPLALTLSGNSISGGKGTHRNLFQVFVSINLEFADFIGFQNLGGILLGIG
ncbi:hypothetical protein K1719_042354 [Acacia pycnantha]|nr:hypothetical protein K1719_042354 [Acacia pycnantha]